MFYSWTLLYFAVVHQLPTLSPSSHCHTPEEAVGVCVWECECVQQLCALVRHPEVLKALQSLGMTSCVCVCVFCRQIEHMRTWISLVLLF